MLGFHSIEAGIFPGLRKQPPSRPKPAKQYGDRAAINAYAPKMQAKVATVGSMPSVTVPQYWKQTDKVPVPVDQTNLVNIMGRIWDIIQHNQSRMEREVQDLRQQQSLLVNRREEESAEINNVISELAALKQRLSRTLSQAEGQLHAMEKASVPAQLQKDIAQLQTESNWLYATVSVPRLFYYAKPTTTLQPSGYYSQVDRIIVLYKTVENEEGLWMQTRQAHDPDKRYWIRLIDAEERMTIGKFDVISSR
jgi:hypothetical protein